MLLNKCAPVVYKADPFRYRRGLEGSTAARGASFVPAIDVHRRDDALFLSVELPGVDSEHVAVELEGAVLTISGTKERVVTEGESKLHSERAYGEFSRSFTLPYAVQPSAIEATFRAGILEVKLPRPEEAKPRRIDIN